MDFARNARWLLAVVAAVTATTVAAHFTMTFLHVAPGLLSSSLIMIAAELVIVAVRHRLHLAAVVQRATARARFALRMNRERLLAQERVG